MPEQSRREQAREAVKRGREKAQAGAERVRETKRRGEAAIQEGRERVQGAKEGAQQAQRRWSGGSAKEAVKEEARAALSGGEGEGEQSPGQGQAPPQRGAGTPQQSGEVPPDNGAPPDTMPSIEAFERSMVGGDGARHDPKKPPAEEDNRMPTMEEFEAEFFSEDNGIEAFERDFLRRL